MRHLRMYFLSLNRKKHFFTIELVILNFSNLVEIKQIKIAVQIHFREAQFCCIRGVNYPHFPVFHFRHLYHPMALSHPLVMHCVVCKLELVVFIIDSYLDIASAAHNSRSAIPPVETPLARTTGCYGSTFPTPLNSSSTSSNLTSSAAPVWTNWAGNVRCQPQQYLFPRTQAELRFFVFPCYYPASSNIAPEYRLIFR